MNFIFLFDNCKMFHLVASRIDNFFLKNKEDCPCGIFMF